jgi:hypothetical protein
VEAVVIAVAALACPIGMVVMGWVMAKGMRKPDAERPPAIDDLRAEHRRLGAEIERLEAAEVPPDKVGASER